MDKSRVTSALLEERVAMYLQAIEFASDASQRRQILEKDIQTLIDLMEQVNMGRIITADKVPPPIQLHPNTGGTLADPIAELSARQADYHKALYFADIQIGEDRTQQIQMLQHGLQVIHHLQEKVMAGIPIGVQEVPPPVVLPKDDDFVPDPPSILSERIPLYQQAIECAKQDGDSRRVKRLETGIEKLQYLLKRAQSRIPIYKKDVPPIPALSKKPRKVVDQYRETVELLTKMSALSARAAKLAADRGDAQMEMQLQNNAKMLLQVLRDFEAGKPVDLSACPFSLVDIERLADQAGVPGAEYLQDVETLQLRLKDYKSAALKAKQAGQTDVAIQHLKVVKTLQSMISSAENEGTVDMTQLPPAPPAGPATERVMETVAQPATISASLNAKNLQAKSLAEELSAFLGEPQGPLPLQNATLSQPPWTSDSEDNSLSHIIAQNSSFETENSEDNSHIIAENSSLETENSSLNQETAISQSSSASTGVQNILHKNHIHLLDDQLSFRESELQAITTSPLPVKKINLPDHSSPASLSPNQEKLNHVNGNLSPDHVNGDLSPEHMNGDLSLLDIADSRRFNSTLSPDKVAKLNSLANKRIVLKENGLLPSSPAIRCIEILKYERSLLMQEDSEDARLTSEKLAHQMEEEKQHLRSGSYEIWLAYLGQVEEDVMSINQGMKSAREKGEESLLSSLIIKKELAERELAVMRKRLPELQS